MIGLTMQLLIALGAAHVIGDFLLQNDFIALNKDRLYVLTCHAFGSGAAAYLACGLWGMWWIFAATFVTHWLLDRHKIRKSGSPLGAFLTDQAAHLGVAALIGIAAAWTAPVQTIWPQLSDLGRSILLKVLVATTGLLMAGKVGAILIEIWLRTRGAGDGPRENTEKDVGRHARTVGSLVDAGANLLRYDRYVGVVERLFIFGLVFSGRPVGIGLLLAVKAVLQWRRTKRLSGKSGIRPRRFGTLISFGYGSVVAYGVKLIWNLI